MVFLTEGVKKHAQELGINELDEKKLYRTARDINRFLKSQEQEQLRESEGGEYDEEIERDL